MNGDYFAGRLKELREAAGLTQAQLAEKIGMSLGGLRHLEQGDNRPTWDSVLALAGALGVDCKAFCHEPAEREAAGPGRPPKATAKSEPTEPAKRPRGRPRKGKPS